MADFSEAQIHDSWEMGVLVEGYDKNNYRKDFAGAWMQRSQYGKQGPLGWSIDHKYPKSKGGGENIDNLRPLQWENNNKKADDYPTFKTSKTSEGNNNIDLEQLWTENEDVQKRLNELYKIK